MGRRGGVIGVAAVPERVAYDQKHQQDTKGHDGADQTYGEVALTNGQAAERGQEYGHDGHDISLDSRASPDSYCDAKRGRSRNHQEIFENLQRGRCIRGEHGDHGDEPTKGQHRQQRQDDQHEGKAVRGQR